MDGEDTEAVKTGKRLILVNKETSTHGFERWGKP